MVTKEQLEQALEAWYVARDKVAPEQSAWGMVMESRVAHTQQSQGLGDAGDRLRLARRR